MRPPPKERGRGTTPGLRNTATSSPCSSKGTAQVRLAEDGGEKLAEIVRWIDSLDLVVLDALDGGGYTPGEALEFVLVGHGKVRRLVDFALVEVS